MKKVLFAVLASALLATTVPASAAPKHPQPVAQDCSIKGPNWFGVAHVADVGRVTTITLRTFTTTVTTTHLGLVWIPAKTVTVTIFHHTYNVFIPAHWGIGPVHTTTTTTHTKPHTSHHPHFNVGQYVGTAIASAAVGEIIQAALVSCRQLTLSESYANAADAFLPFIGGWLVKRNMPDTPETYAIAKWAKDHHVSSSGPDTQKVLDMYVKAYAKNHKAKP